MIIRETVDESIYFRYDDRFGFRPPRYPMPVPVAQLHMAQLDRGLRSSAHGILSFLAAHPDLAYNTEELVDEFRPGDTEAFKEALLFLSDIGAVDERIVHGRDYYVFVAEVEGLNP